MKIHSLGVLLVLLPALAAAKYDPNADRAALRGAATASYGAAAEAAGLALEPAKAPAIKAALDECVRQASFAADAAKSLQTAAALRGDGMDGLLKGGSGPAPEAAAKDQSAAAAAARTRAKALSQDKDALSGKIEALPDKTPDGKPNEKKIGLKASLDEAAGMLAGADAALRAAEAGAAAMAEAAARMKDFRRRSLGPAAELAAAGAEAVRLSDALPPPVAEAKTAVDLLGQEPQGVNRTRAGDKLGVPRELARRLLAAADRACNRADDFRGLSDAFELSRAAFEEARQTSADRPQAAKTALDRAEKSLADIRGRLDLAKQ